MTTTYHTVIATGAAANASTFNAPLATLDAELVSLNTDIGTMASLTTTATTLVTAINEVDADVVLVNAEIDAAQSPYSTLKARLDALAIAGGNVSTLTNGAANAAQKVVTVDSTTGFLAGAPVAYTLVGGVVETNTIDTVDSPTQITLDTVIGAGGIGDNTFIIVIAPGTLVSTGAVKGATAQQQELEKGWLVADTAGTAGKWSMVPTYVTFDGQRDEVAFLGWNVTGLNGGRFDGAAASIYLGFESDYYTGGQHYSEAYIEFYNPTGLIQRRGWSTTIDHATGVLVNQYWGQHIFYESDGSLAWQIDASANLSSAHLIRFTQNDGSVLTQINAAGDAYISLIRLSELDAIVLGGTDSYTIMAQGTAARVGVGESYPDSKLHVTQAGAGTDTVIPLVTISHNKSTAVAAGFGSSLLFELQDDAAEDIPAASIAALWNDPTNTATKGDLVAYAYDTAAREGWRVRGAGSAAAIGFLGATPAARIAHVADPSGGAVTDAEARSAINSILATLETFGFHATS